MNVIAQAFDIAHAFSRIIQRGILCLLILAGAGAQRADAQTTVINYGDIWRYSIPTSDPGSNWRSLSFDDSSWTAGPGLLGFETALMPGPGMQTNLNGPRNEVVYLFRKTFTYNGDPTDARFVIDQIVDDGVSYYLNGNLLGSVRHTPGVWNVGGSPVTDATEELRVLSGPAVGLINGTNVLCAEVHNTGPNGSDLVFGARFKITRSLPGVYPIRIMPFGDSITSGDGGGNPPGYRKFLFDSLTAAGYQVDFVGTMTYNSGGWTGDIDHQGGNGLRIDNLEGGITGWMENIKPPEVVLLLAGTNDFGQNYDIDNAINRLDSLITKVASLAPQAHIIVSNLLQRTDNATLDANIQTKFNPFVSTVVANQAAAGKRVTYVDLRSRISPSDLSDQLHPSPTGHSKLAAGWQQAIQSVMDPQGDELPPGINRVTALDATHVRVIFGKALDESTVTPASFTINNGVIVSSVSLDSSKREVTLTTSPLSDGGYYQVSVSNIRDRFIPAHTVAANTSAPFRGMPLRGANHHVPEASKYQLVYSLDIPNSATFNATAPAYSVDRHVGLPAFSRIAYYLELQKPGQGLQYCWISMDAFTNDAGKIGVPVASSGAFFQQYVFDVNVVSNVPGVTTGTGGIVNLEFWPRDYGPTNTFGVDTASDSFFDMGDQPFGSNGFGSMQIHGYYDKPYMCYNHWGNGGAANSDIGIGLNSSGIGDRDWTNAANANQYSVKTLQVYVKPAAENQLSLRASRINGNAVQLLFDGIPGGVYRVQRSTALGAGAVWSNLSDVTANDYGEISYTDRTAPADKAYYRLERISP